MKESTLGIIAICKGNTRYNLETGLVNAVKNYMSDFCLCEKELFSDEQLEYVLKDAFYDFIDACDKPSFFLKLLEEITWINKDLATRICMVFKYTQVREGSLYINGFDGNFEKIIDSLR